MSMKQICLAQVSCKLGRVNENFERHVEIVEQARRDGADLLVFPELSLCGYQLKDLVSDVALPIETVLEGWQRLGAGRPIEVVFGYLEQSPGFQYYNAMMHLRIDENGQPTLLHNHRKLNLPTYGMFEEERYFSGGNRLRAYDSPLLGRTGLLICEDLWHPANPLILSMDGPGMEGVGTIIAGSNSPARGVAGGDTEPANTRIWKLLARFSALAYNCLVIVCQRVGVEDGFVYTGGSEVIGPGGVELAKAGLFDEQILTCRLDLEALIRERRTMLPGGTQEDYERLQRELNRVGRVYLQDSKR